MPILLEKILTLFIMPLGLALVLGLTAMALIGFRRLRLGGLMLSFAIAILWTFSTPVIAKLLLATSRGPIP